MLAVHESFVLSAVVRQVPLESGTYVSNSIGKSPDVVLDKALDSLLYVPGRRQPFLGPVTWTEFQGFDLVLVEKFLVFYCIDQTVGYRSHEPVASSCFDRLITNPVWKVQDVSFLFVFVVRDLLEAPDLIHNHGRREVKQQRPPVSCL